MANIEEFKESMTIYYSLSTGIIRMITTGVQDMSIYGDQEAEMKLIQDCIVMSLNKDILDNRNNYKVNVETKQVVKILESETEIEINNLKENNIAKDERIKALEDESIKLKVAMADIYESLLGGE